MTDLLSPPGLVGQIAAYHDKSSRREAPVYGLAAGLAAVSFLAGGRYVLDLPNGQSPTNIYTVAVGDTGSGKEHPRTVLMEVAKLAEDQAYMTEAASATAFLKTLEKHKRMCSMPDEMGLSIAAANTDAGGHQRAVINELMKAYGLALSSMPGKAYADDKKNIDPIDNPYVTVFGTSTFETLADGLTAEDAVSGYLNRLEIMIEPDVGPFRDGAAAKLNGSTERAIKELSKLGQTMRRQADNKKIKLTHNGFIPIRPQSDAVFELCISVRNDMDQRRAGSTGPAVHLWARAYERILRIAAVVALGDTDPDKPVLKKQHVEWSAAYMKWQIENVMTLFGRVGDNSSAKHQDMIVDAMWHWMNNPGGTDTDPRQFRVFEELNKKGYVALSQIARLVSRKMELFERENALTKLVEMGTIVEQKEASGEDRATGIKTQRGRIPRRFCFAEIHAAAVLEAQNTLKTP